MSRIILGAPTSGDAGQLMTGGGSMAGNVPTEGSGALQKILGLLAAKKGQYGTAWSILKPDTATTQKPTETEFKNKLNAASGLAAVQTVKDEIKRTGGKVMLSNVLPGALGRLAGASKYRTAISNMTDVLTRLRTGAALNEQEIKFYKELAPQIGDSPTDIDYKLSMFEQLYSSILKGDRSNPQGAIDIAGQLPDSFVPEDQAGGY